MVRKRVLVLATVVAAWCALFSWALASPPGSAPDDDFHLPSIMCGRGEVPGQCEPAPGGGPDVRTVPVEASGAAICFARDSTRSGACTQDLDGSLDPDIETDRGNWTGDYPPVFYFLASFLVTGDIESTVLLVRGFASLVVVGVVAALWAALPGRRRPLVLVPLVVTSVPLGMSTMASTNPTGWAVASASVVWLALFASFEVDGRRRWWLCALAAVGAVMGAGSRTDAALFTLLAVGLVGLMRVGHLRAPRSHLLPVVTGLGVVVLSLALFSTAGQSSALQSGFAGMTSDRDRTELLWSNLDNLPALWLGWFGNGPLGSLGWFDTPLPPLVGFAGVSVWGTVAVAGWRGSRGLQLVSLLVVVAAMVVFPLYLLGRSGLPVGEGFQPRYLLPLLVVLTGIGLLGASTRGGSTPVLTRWQVVLLVGALSLAHSRALFVQERRYVTGTDVASADLGGGREWWWRSLDAVPPGAVWLVGTVSFLVVSAVALTALRDIGPGGQLAETGTRPTHRSRERPRRGARRRRHVTSDTRG